MKKGSKRRAIIAIILIVVILAIVAGIIYWVSIRKKKQAPINSFKTSIDSIINNTYGDDFYYVTLSGNRVYSLSNGEISSSIISKIDYKIIDIEYKDNAAVVKSQFTYPNAVSVHKEIVDANENIEESELVEKFIDRIQSGKYSTSECTIDIPMVKVNDIWYIIESEEFNDVITGGIYSEYRKQNGEIYNMLKALEEWKWDWKD